LTYDKNKRNLFKYLKSDVIKGSTSSVKPIYNLPLPVVVINSKGCIVWYNKCFENLLQNERIYEINICDYFGIIPEEIISNSSTFDVLYNKKHYKVIGNLINNADADESNIILYWDETTDFENLKTIYENEKFVCGIALIDNYDELMQNTSNSDKPKLVASIEELLDEYAQNSCGILRKYEKDRFYFYFQKQYLDNLYNDKFQILDRIKDIKVGNSISPTLSIGIGFGGSVMSENETFSLAALDMALGRGGDQVIIKNKDDYHFFGGKSSGIEKHSRVKSRIVAHALKGLAEDADNIIIVGHKRADLDVVGAAIGLYSAFKYTDKNIYIVIDKENQTVDKFLSQLDYEYRNRFIDKNEAMEYVLSSSLVIVVDTHKVSLTEQPELLDVAQKIVVIDHHRKSADFISNAILTFHEHYASSASELVTEVIQYINDGTSMDKTTAEALYAGIYLDTKGFNFKTGVRTFEAAAYLKRHEVDTIKIKKLFQIDMQTFMNKCSIIENVKELRKSIAIATCVSKDNDDMQTVVAQATDELLNINNITTAFVLCDMGGGNIIISARSLGETNVQVIMEKLGGGGHMTIAGAQLANSDLQSAIDLLTIAVDECI
jgi:c-di-AMP phosphodiesterase-like protein